MEFAVDRPDVPAGYGLHTGTAGQLPWSWVEDQLVRARNYWVCTTRADGRPHAMPVWGVWVDAALMFSTDPSSLKGRNVAARPQVVVHLESGDDMVVLEGAATRLERSRIDAFVTAYDEKYGVRVDASNEQFGLYQLEPDRVLAWQETDFPASATRFRRSL